MQVNHEATRQILSCLEDLLDLSLVEISTDNNDYLDRPSGSEYVTLEKENRIGFEVFSDEIRVDFLTTIPILDATTALTKMLNLTNSRSRQSPYCAAYSPRPL